MHLRLLRWLLKAAPVFSASKRTLVDQTVQLKTNRGSSYATPFFMIQKPLASEICFQLTYRKNSNMSIVVVMICFPAKVSFF